VNSKKTNMVLKSKKTQIVAGLWWLKTALEDDLTTKKVKREWVSKMEWWWCGFGGIRAVEFGKGKSLRGEKDESFCFWEKRDESLIMFWIYQYHKSHFGIGYITTHKKKKKRFNFFKFLINLWRSKPPVNLDSIYWRFRLSLSYTSLKKLINFCVGFFHLLAA
jgi:hypothetical protein